MSEQINTSGGASAPTYAVSSATAGNGLTGYTATENYEFGTQAGASQSGTTGNIFGGYQAGWQVTSGSYNLAIGYQALRNGTTTGSYNIALGFWAGKALTTGANTIALGNTAGQNITTGSGNIVLGYQAALALTTWANNVVIGYQAGQAITTTGINEPAPSVAIGNLAMKYLSADGGNVAIGSGSVGGNGAAGGSQTAYRAVGIGRNALGVLTQGTHNTAIGDTALPALTTGGSNTAIGRAAGNTCVTSGYNVFAGHAAGFYVNPTAASYSYTPLGGSALNLLGDNICVGNSAGGSYTLNQSATQTTGFANIALGTYSGPNAITVNQSICVGIFANTNTSNTTVIGQQQTAALISGNLCSSRALTGYPSATALTWSAPQMMGGILIRSGGAALTDTTPTASAIVAAIPGCENGSSYEVTVINSNSGTLTLAAGIGVTLAGNTTIASGNTRRYTVLVTNAVSGSQAVTLVGLFTAAA